MAFSMTEEVKDPTVFVVAQPQPSNPEAIDELPSFQDLANQTKAKEETKEEEAPTAETSPTPQEPGPTPEKQYTNPHARARILEREKIALERKIGDLEVMVGRLVKQNQAEMEEDLKAPPKPKADIKENPAQALADEIAELKSRMDETATAIKNEREQADRTRVLSGIANRMSQVQNDPVMRGAMEHIGYIMQHNIESAHKDKTHAERLEIGRKAVEDMYIGIAKAGGDPAEHTVELAIRYGFNPDSVAKPSPVASNTQTKKVDDAKATITADKKKAEGTVSLGGVGGKAPSKTSTAKLVEGTEDDFVFRVKQLQQEGTVRKGRLGVPSFGDLARASQGTK